MMKYRINSFWAIILIIFVFAPLFPMTSSATNNFSIVAVKRAIPMSNTVNDIHKDFYINMGDVDGLRIGSFLNVFRRVTFRQKDSSRPATDLKILVAQLKIIYVQSDLSVGRIAYKTKGSELPILDIGSVMVGDVVELSAEGGEHLVSVK